MWGAELAVMAAMIALNALFAAYEIALASLALARLQVLANEQRTGAKAALAMKQNMEASLAVVQVGITLVGVIAAATGGASAADEIKPQVQEFFQLSRGMAEFVSLTLIVIPLTLVTILFGELIPKVFALRNAEWVCLRMSPGMRWFSATIYPIVWCLEASVKGLIRWSERFWKHKVTSEASTPGWELQELRASAALARTSRLIGQQEEKIIVEAMSLARRSVEECMLPAEFISMIDLNSTIGEALVAAHLDMHTRFPVTGTPGDPQAICGYITFKDIVTHMRTNPKDASLTSIVRTIASVPAGLSVAQALERLTREHVHIALVRDSAGRVVGLITMEDLMEELVGEIEDEYDRLPAHLVPIGRGWIVGGGLSLETLRRQTGLNLIEDPPRKDIRTLDDWIGEQIGGPIHGGETLNVHGMRIVVRKSRRHSVMEAYVQRLAAEEQPRSA